MNTLAQPQQNSVSALMPLIGTASALIALFGVVLAAGGTAVAMMMYVSP